MTHAPIVAPATRSFKGFCLAAIFTGAFLLFLVQPLIGKAIIPTFGGTAATWSVILLFFQFILLGGYLAAYFISRLPHEKQPLVYAALGLAALAFSQIKPQIDPSFAIGASPQLTLLALLLKCVGLPCLFLATISTTIQNWWGNYARTNPYPLYSLSNAGSLLALLAFPVLLEPRLTLNQIFITWRVLFGLLVVLCLAATGLIWQGKFQKPAPQKADKHSKAPFESPVLWVWIPALTCSLLLSITEYLCHDIAPIPLLWILPLAAFLLSYILVFNESLRFNQTLLAVLAFLAVIAFYSLPYLKPAVLVSICVTLFAFFSLCLWAHHWLVRLKPAPSRLPSFYFFTALGGAAGGMAVSMVAPCVFTDYRERWITIGLLILSLTLLQITNSSLKKPLKFLAKSTAVPVSALVTFSFFMAMRNETSCVYKSRNFYGVLKLMDRGPYVQLMHGSTVHGAQLKDLIGPSLPSTYYHPESGIGLMMMKLREQNQNPLKVGVLGLGTGTMAGYGRDGDTFVFYDINPAVLPIAKEKFRFLKECRSTIRIVMGDGRLSLQNSAPEKFDLLLIDAFSSDSIPVHLMTQEAMQIYMKHLAPNGVLAFHLSNRYLNLSVLAATLAQKNKLSGCIVKSPGSRSGYYLSSIYALMRRIPFILDVPPGVRLVPLDFYRPIDPWTDDYSNVLGLLNTRR